MKKAPKKMFIFAGVIAITILITAFTVFGSTKITVSEGVNSFELGGINYEIPVNPFLFRGETYLPVDSVLPPCGVSGR